MQAPPERLGSFYLGAEYDLTRDRLTENAVHYDARDLTTHAICVGMTGSGKTGLCMGLLEEAAIDGVPALIIDPKGTMTNLLLQFPELRGQDFEPWVNPDDARRASRTVPAFAEATADQWRNGLARWGIRPDRVRQLQEAADLNVYTPGSDAGLLVSVVSSFAAPEPSFEENPEAVRERINGTATALLGLVGVKADPLRSREAILLSNIFEYYWQRAQDLDLATLIQSVQDPPIRQLGMFDVDTFFPQKQRFELAMAFNNLMAAPGFRSWLAGEALDMDRLLYTDNGKPRHAVFYLAHLSDSERMFFVTLLLESLVTWMRRQTGTTSLRALLYFDELFGYFPATAAPPSKRPLLTLLKQARAFGVGCVLASQNPIDIDYKGLTNAGTWFIGKLQTQKDIERLMHGLRGAIVEAGGDSERLQVKALISQLRSRLFILHNVHQDQPLVLKTRWVMSYLRGPLTKPQVRQLMAGRLDTSRQLRPTEKLSESHVITTVSAATPAQATSAPVGYTHTPPALDPSIPEVCLPLVLSEAEALRQLSRQTGHQLDVERTLLIYEPALLGATSVRFVDRKRKINEQIEKTLLARAPDSLGGVEWDAAEAVSLGLGDLTRTRPPDSSDQGPFYAPVPESVNSARKIKDIAHALADWLYFDSRLTITVHPELDIFQRPGETERSFKIRSRQAARERRDAEVDKLADRYEDRIERLEAKLRKEERELIADQADYDARKREEHITLGETVLSFFMGRRRTRTISTVARKRRLSEKAKLDIVESQEEIEDLEEDIAEIEAELEEATKEISRKWADLLDDLMTEELHPRRTDVDVRLVALAWLPHWLITFDDGIRARTATLAAYTQAHAGARGELTY